MEPLFTPWRMEYVSSADRKEAGECIFCRAATSNDDPETLTVWRWSSCFAMLNRYPYTSGHTMIAPLVHEGRLVRLPTETLAEMMEAVKVVVRVLDELYHPHGFNVGFNLGEAAGAGIPEHLHLHVVPRWRADTNFISVVGNARIIPEDLSTTYHRVRDALMKTSREEGP